MNHQSSPFKLAPLRPAMVMPNTQGIRANNWQQYRGERGHGGAVDGL